MSKKEQEKWDAWKANEGLSRTEAKRRYIEKLIETMHKYASTTTEAKELVEELEFVWIRSRTIASTRLLSVVRLFNTLNAAATSTMAALGRG